MTFKVGLTQHYIACVRDVLEVTAKAVSSSSFNPQNLAFKESTQKIFAK